MIAKGMSLNKAGFWITEKMPVEVSNLRRQDEA
jgi:hypothetical protein